MRIKLAVAISVLCLPVSVTAISAHHSVEKQYDVSNTIKIRGVVTRTEWRNPHSLVFVDARNNDGTVSSWEMELPAPNALTKENLAKDFVKHGDSVTVDLWRAKDGSNLAHALTMTTADGRIMNFPRTWPSTPK